MLFKQRLFLTSWKLAGNLPNLKPHVRHQRVYGMGTSGVMLIPVTPPTQCVAECAKCRFSGQATQANTAWGPSTDLIPWVHCPNGPQFKMAVRVTSEHTYARNARARIRAVQLLGLLHTEVVWHRDTSQSPHAIRCSPTRPHMNWRMDWLCDGGWTLGMGQYNEIIHIFLRRYQCIFTLVRKRGIRTHTNFTSQWFTNCICVSHVVTASAAKLCLQLSSA